MGTASKKDKRCGGIRTVTKGYNQKKRYIYKYGAQNE